MNKKAETVLQNSKIVVPIARDLLTECNLPNDDSNVKEMTTQMLEMLKGWHLSIGQDSNTNKEIVTILVSPESKKKWNSLRNYPDESYEDMFNRFIRIVEEEEKDLTKEDWEGIERSLEEIEKEDTVSHDYIKKCYNIN